MQVTPLLHPFSFQPIFSLKLFFDNCPLLHHKALRSGTNKAGGGLSPETYNVYIYKKLSLNTCSECPSLTLLINCCLPSERQWRGENEDSQTDSNAPRYRMKPTPLMPSLCTLRTRSYSISHKNPFQVSPYLLYRQPFSNQVVCLSHSLLHPCPPTCGMVKKDKLQKMDFNRIDAR